MNPTIAGRAGAIIAVLGLALSMVVSTASPAEALSCPTGQVVWIKSNTTVNAGHGWLSGAGYQYYGSGGWHTTVTHVQNSGFTWIDTDGELLSADIYCNYDAS